MLWNLVLLQIATAPVEPLRRGGELCIDNEGACLVDEAFTIARPSCWNRESDQRRMARARFMHLMGCRNAR